MVQHPRRRRSDGPTRPFRLAGVALLGIMLSSCSFIEIDSPLTTFEPAGPIADRIDGLFWPVFWIATAIFVVVQGAIVFSVIAFRDRPGRKEPKQTHGNAKLEITWTVIPALILAGIAIPTVRGVFDLAECAPDAMNIEVIGHQWWFEYQYPEHGIETANVLVMPAGQEICAVMTSEDVLHNFWIPALNGKRYLVPGQTTYLRLEAYEPGLFWGHCGEFCGLSHSLMRAQAEVLSPADFDAWIVAQQQAAAVPAEGTQAWDGLQVFLNRGCTQCHTVDIEANDLGIEPNILASDVFNGPNLTHFASREVFAGAYLPYEGLSYNQALTEWLANPPAVKPGSFMPDLGLTQQEIDDLIAWMETLS
ncbi:MAG TPA: cytochrome c oxidase subunit II [Acidimicrobiia bacterium]|nr:cytochrome c oxidase subunit II [Acidimicrobiia bacterium]